jgi:hypothetical protein
MGLGMGSIQIRDQMMKKFLEYYQDCCKYKEKRGEVFRMKKHEDEILEDYVERFNYNFQMTRQGDFTPIHDMSYY